MSTRKFPMLGGRHDQPACLAVDLKILLWPVGIENIPSESDKTKIQTGSTSDHILV